MAESAELYDAAFIEQLAGLAHEANRAHCMAHGDTSQLPWSLAPEWQKESARAGVRAVLDNPNITPEELHQRWMEHKLADGWIYGPVKCQFNKLHPCLVPYEELPAEQRAKDGIFRTTVLDAISFK